MTNPVHGNNGSPPKPLLLPEQDDSGLPSSQEAGLETGVALRDSDALLARFAALTSSGSPQSLWARAAGSDTSTTSEEALPILQTQGQLSPEHDAPITAEYLRSLTPQNKPPDCFFLDEDSNPVLLFEGPYHKETIRAVVLLYLSEDRQELRHTVFIDKPSETSGFGPASATGSSEYFREVAALLRDVRGYTYEDKIVSQARKETLQSIFEKGLPIIQKQPVKQNLGDAQLVVTLKKRHVLVKTKQARIGATVENCILTAETELRKQRGTAVESVDQKLARQGFAVTNTGDFPQQLTPELIKNVPVRAPFVSIAQTRQVKIEFYDETGIKQGELILMGGHMFFFAEPVDKEKMIKAGPAIVAFVKEGKQHPSIRPYLLQNGRTASQNGKHYEIRGYDIVEVSQEARRGRPKRKTKTETETVLRSPALLAYVDAAKIQNGLGPVTYDVNDPHFHELPITVDYLKAIMEAGASDHPDVFFIKGKPYILLRALDATKGLPDHTTLITLNDEQKKLVHAGFSFFDEDTVFKMQQQGLIGVAEQAKFLSNLVFIEALRKALYDEGGIDEKVERLVLDQMQEKGVPIFYGIPSATNKGILLKNREVTLSAVDDPVMKRHYPTGVISLRPSSELSVLNYQFVLDKNIPGVMVMCKSDQTTIMPLMFFANDERIAVVSMKDGELHFTLINPEIDQELLVFLDTRVTGNYAFVGDAAYDAAQAFLERHKEDSIQITQYGEAINKPVGDKAQFQVWSDERRILFYDGKSRDISPLYLVGDYAVERKAAFERGDSPKPEWPEPLSHNELWLKFVERLEGAIEVSGVMEPTSTSAARIDRVDHTQPITVDYLKAIKAQGFSDQPGIKFINGQPFVYLEHQEEDGAIAFSIITLMNKDSTLGITTFKVLPAERFAKDKWKKHFRTKRLMLQSKLASDLMKEARQYLLANGKCPEKIKKVFTELAGFTAIVPGTRVTTSRPNPMGITSYTLLEGRSVVFQTTDAKGKEDVAVHSMLPASTVTDSQPVSEILEVTTDQIDRVDHTQPLTIEYLGQLKAQGFSDHPNIFFVDGEPYIYFEAYKPNGVVVQLVYLDGKTNQIKMNRWFDATEEEIARLTLGQNYEPELSYMQESKIKTARLRAYMRGWTKDPEYVRQMIAEAKNKVQRLISGEEVEQKPLDQSREYNHLQGRFIVTRTGEPDGTERTYTAFLPEERPIDSFAWIGRHTLNDNIAGVIPIRFQDSTEEASRIFLFEHGAEVCVLFTLMNSKAVTFVALDPVQHDKLIALLRKVSAETDPDRKHLTVLDVYEDIMNAQGKILIDLDQSETAYSNAEGDELRIEGRRLLFTAAGNEAEKTFSLVGDPVPVLLKKQAELTTQEALAFSSEKIDRIDHTQPITVEYLKAIKAQGYSDHPDIKVIKGHVFVIYYHQRETGELETFLITLKNNDNELGFFLLSEFPESFFEKDNWRKHFKSRNEMREAKENNSMFRKIRLFLTEKKEISPELARQIFDSHNAVTIRQGIATTTMAGDETGTHSTSLLQGRSLIISLKHSTGYEFEDVFHLASETETALLARQAAHKKELFEAHPNADAVDHDQPITKKYLQEFEAQGFSHHPDVFFLKGKAFLFLEDVKKAFAGDSVHFVFYDEKTNRLCEITQTLHPEHLCHDGTWQNYFDTRDKYEAYKRAKVILAKLERYRNGETTLEEELYNALFVNKQFVIDTFDEHDVLDMAVNGKRIRTYFEGRTLVSEVSTDDGRELLKMCAVIPSEEEISGLNWVNREGFNTNIPGNIRVKFTKGDGSTAYTRLSVFKASDNSLAVLGRTESNQLAVFFLDPNKNKILYEAINKAVADNRAIIELSPAERRLLAAISRSDQTNVSVTGDDYAVLEGPIPYKTDQKIFIEGRKIALYTQDKTRPKIYGLVGDPADSLQEAKKTYEMILSGHGDRLGRAVDSPNINLKELAQTDHAQSISYPDIPVEGIENLELKRIEFDPSPTGQKPPVDVVLYEDVATGYGVAVYYENKEKKITPNIELIQIYRRMPGDKITSLYDLYCCTVTMAPFDMSRFMATEKKETEFSTAPVTRFALSEAYGQAQYDDGLIPDSFLVSLKERIPPQKYEKTISQSMLMHSIDGEQYKDNSLAFIKATLVISKLNNKQTRVTQQQYKFILNDVEWQVVINMNSAGRPASAYFKSDKKILRATHIEKIPKAYSDEHDRYVLSVRIEDKRIILSYYPPENESSNPQRVEFGGLTAPDILIRNIEASPIRLEVPENGLSYHRFYRIDQNQLSEDLSAYELYEDKVFGLGIAVKVIYGEHGQKIIDSIIVYKKSDQIIHNLADVLKCATFVDCQIAKEKLSWAVGEAPHIKKRNADGDLIESFGIFVNHNQILTVTLTPHFLKGSYGYEPMLNMSDADEELIILGANFFSATSMTERPVKQIDEVLLMEGHHFRYHSVLMPEGDIHVTITLLHTGKEEKPVQAELKTVKGIKYFTAVIDDMRLTGQEVLSAINNSQPPVAVVLQKITNFKELKAKEALRKKQEEEARIQAQIQNLQEAIARTVPQANHNQNKLDIQWPGRNQKLKNNTRTITTQPIQIDIVSINVSGASNYREFGFLLESASLPQNFEMILRWGAAAGNSYYQASARKNEQGQVELVLTPELKTGAPTGQVVFNLVTNTLSAPDADKEISAFLFGRNIVPEYTMTFDNGLLTITSDQNIKSTEPLLTPKIWAIWQDVEGAVSPVQNENGSWTITVPLAGDVSLYADKVQQTRAVFDAMKAEIQSQPLSSWNRYFTEVSLPDIVLSKTHANDTDNQVLAVLIRQVDNGSSQYYLKDILFRGLDPGDIKNGYFKIDGKDWDEAQLTEHGMPIEEGAIIDVRLDTRYGWEDVELFFTGDKFEVGQQSFVSREAQTVFDSAQEGMNIEYETRLLDGSIKDGTQFKMNLRLVADYRSDKDPKPLIIDHVSLEHDFTADELAALGFDFSAPVKLVSYPTDLRAGGVFVFRFNGASSAASMGEMSFYVDWAGDDHKQLRVTRLLSEVDDAHISLGIEKPYTGRRIVKTRFRGREISFPVSMLKPNERARAFPVVSPANVEGVIKALSLMGHEVASTTATTGGPKVISVDVVPEMDNEGRILNTRAEFYETRLNSDGTRPVRSIYLSRNEYLKVREALDGIGVRYSVADRDFELFNTAQPPFSIASELSIRSGDAFLPTKETLQFIAEIYKKAKRGESPFPDGYQLEQRLDFENEEGLVLSIPVKWRHRSANPFELDVEGKFLKDAVGNDILEEGVPVVVEGRRIETYTKGRPETRRPVSHRFRAYEQGGFWRFYSMAFDPETGEHKAFNLNIVQFAFEKNNEKSPSVFALYSSTDGTSEENKEQYKRRARMTLNYRVRETFEEASNIQALAEALHIPTLRQEKEGDEFRLAFVTPDQAGLQVMSELTGFKLDRTSHRIDFEEFLSLTIRTLKPEPEDENDLYSYETIKLEHTFSERDRVVRLTEVLPEGSPERPRMWEWNLVLETLTQTKYNPDKIVDDQLEGRWQDYCQRLLRGQNIPVFTGPHKDRVKHIQREVVGDKVGATIKLANPDVPVVPFDLTGFVMPDSSDILEITDVDEVMEILAEFDLHDEFFSPDEPTVMVQNLVGSNQEYMTFISRSGIILQIPMIEGDKHPYDYLLDDKPDPVLGKQGVRLLIPNNRYHEKIYEALVNKRYQVFDKEQRVALGITSSANIELRDYQIEAVNNFKRSYKEFLANGSGAKRGIFVMPTGSGKTKMAAAAMVEAFAQSVLAGTYTDGDKIVVTTHLPDNIPHLKKGIEEVLGPVFELLTGRPLRVTSVAGSGTKERTVDVTGDVVILGIQKVTRADDEIINELAGNLGAHKLLMTVLDEIHHSEADTWQEIIAHLRRLSPKMYELGLTATPKRDKSRKIIESDVLYMAESLDLMKQGALPNVSILEFKTNEHVGSLRRGGSGSTNGEFTRAELSTAVNSSQRNRLIIEKLEQHGHKNPDNPRALAPSRIIAIDENHARTLAREYQEYFEKGLGYTESARKSLIASHPLRARRAEALIPGETVRGKITAADLERAVQKKINGEIDAIVVMAIGSGITDEARELLRQYSIRGLIECQVTVDLFLEGSDDWYLQNLVLARPVKSIDFLTQMVGRLTRRGPKEVDYSAGRILRQIPKRIIQAVDTHLSGQPVMARECFGYYRVIEKDQPFDMIRGEVEHKEPTHLEVANMAHAKRLSGENNQILELEVGSPARNKQYTLKMVAERADSTYGKRKICGFMATQDGRDSEMSSSALAELKEWIEYLRMGQEPDEFADTAEVITVDGQPAIELSNGSKLKIHIEKQSEGTTSYFEIIGIKTEIGKNGTSKRTYIDYIDAGGNERQYNVYKPHNNSSYLYLEDTQTKQICLACVDKDGLLVMWQRRDKVREFIQNASSNNYTMRGIHDSTYNKRKSFASRRVVSDPSSPYDYEITEAVGRWKGTGSHTPTELSVSGVPRVRYQVGVGDDGNLIAGMGQANTTEKERGQYFPYSENEGKQVQIEIVEDTWVDHATGELKRGKVRIYFYLYQVEYIHGEKIVTRSPYSWREYESREHLLGPSQKFRIKQVHYHEQHFDKDRKAIDYNRMPSNAGYLLFGGAGMLTGDRLGMFIENRLEYFINQHITNSSDRTRVRKLLRGVKNGQVQHLPSLLSILSVLDCYGFLDYYHRISGIQSEDEGAARLLSARGEYDHKVVAALAHYAITPQRPTYILPDLKVTSETVFPSEKVRMIKPRPIMKNQLRSPETLDSIKPVSHPFTPLPETNPLMPQLFDMTTQQFAGATPWSFSAMPTMNMMSPMMI